MFLDHEWTAPSKAEAEREAREARERMANRVVVDDDPWRLPTPTGK